ncbi:hypothetical protein ABZ918_10465 [Streptomyces viridosporus]|uniref:hypothetical protein n=1 Tax=Streptomyces viridosporus TaxID=67581 RepID=UPI00343EFCBF
MASWGRNIVIAEPAPAVAHPARYLAPVFREDESDDVFIIPILIVFGIGIVFVTLGGGAGELAAQVIGPAARVPVWICFDAIVAAALFTAYVLTARYGLRYPTGENATTAVTQRRLLVEQGNAAWRCLPEPQQQTMAEQLRTMNAAARLTLIDPDDTHADSVLRTNAQALHQLTLTVLDTRQSTQAPDAS